MTIQIQQPDPTLYPDLQLEDVLSASVNVKLLAHDRQLFETKWWDYRFMSPYQATMAYVDAYAEVCRTVYAQVYDYERAQHMRFATAAHVEKKLCENDSAMRKLFSGYWRGRQVADALGMPYDLYCYETLQSRLKAWKRPHLPQSVHLYNEMDVEYSARRWEEFKEARIYYANHHAYLAQNFVGTEIQTAYCDYLIKEAQSTYAPIEKLAEMVGNDHLPLEYLNTQLPAPDLEAVRKALR